MNILYTNLTLAKQENSEREVLTISGLTQNDIEFTKDELRKLPAKIELEIDDPIYGKKMNYEAVPFKSLIKDYIESLVNSDSTIKFECWDKYSADLDIKELLDVNDLNQAYLVFGLSDGSPLPMIIKENNHNKEIGPYYLVWPSPKDGKYKEANWPYNLKSFKFINESFRDQFPNLYPVFQNADSTELINEVSNGLEGFRTNCFVCHAMNGEGKDKMSNVDLKNSGVIRAFDSENIRDFVRNPKKFFINSKMSAFNKSMLSDSDLKAIIQYLKFMQREE